MPEFLDFDKVTPEKYEEYIPKNKDYIESFKLGGEDIGFSMGVIINMIRILVGKLDAIAHVKPNPHEWENRYYAGNAEMKEDKFYNDVFGTQQNLIGIAGEKIPELFVNLFNKSYNFMNPNIRVGENLKVRDTTPLIINGDKITLNSLLNGFPDILKVRQWIDANFSKYFDSNKMCIMPCQIGCQVGCQIAQQLPSDFGNDTCSLYPSGLGINGFHYAYPGRYYDWFPNWEKDKIHAVNSNLDQYEGSEITGPLISPWTFSFQRYTHMFGAATQEIRDKVKAYNKEREAFNRAQIGKNPCVWKPYYSIIWLSFVLPISEEWLDSEKLVEQSLANDRNGAHNYYRNLPRHARWSREGRYLFVKCENDYLITPNTDDNKFEKYQANYYRYIKYPARNGEYKKLKIRRSSDGDDFYDDHGRSDGLDSRD